MSSWVKSPALVAAGVSRLLRCYQTPFAIDIICLALLPTACQEKNLRGDFNPPFLASREPLDLNEAALQVSHMEDCPLVGLKGYFLAQQLVA